MTKTIERSEPTIEEAYILLDTQGDFIEFGKMAIKCPRCGKELIHEGDPVGYSWEVTRCIDETCINIHTRGI